jgi:hypothetical protein
MASDQGACEDGVAGDGEGVLVIALNNAPGVLGVIGVPHVVSWTAGPIISRRGWGVRPTSVLIRSLIPRELCIIASYSEAV